MAKITRKPASIFGLNAGVNEIAQFGSLAASAPAFSTDPTTIQSLANWLQGWFAGVEGPSSPAIEDLNAYCYVMAYQVAYQMQQGIPEWDSATTYYIGSIATDGLGNLYLSLTNSNLNNALTNATNWKLILGTSIIQGSNPNCINIGLKYAAGTLTICAADLTSLSTSNPGYIFLPSSAHNGTTVKLSVTSNVTITDTAGTGELNGNAFGSGSGVAWNSSRPFYLYAANLDDTNAGLAFFMSPFPCYQALPNSSSQFGWKSNPVSGGVTQPSDMVFFTSTTPSSYINKPCRFLGGFFGTKTSSASQLWTLSVTGSIATPGSWNNISKDFGENLSFIYPIGQNGNISTGHLIASGGTAPSFSSDTVTYRVFNNGSVLYNLILNGTATNGSGSIAVVSYPPLFGPNGPMSFTSVGALTTPAGFYGATSHSPSSSTLAVSYAPGNSGSTSALALKDSSSISLKANEFSGASDFITASFMYTL